MIISELEELARQAGFTHWGEVNMQALQFLPAVRDMCGDGKCGSFGRNWCCPPACGTLEEMAEKVRHFSAGILLQTTATLEDSFDFETMSSAAKEHKKRFQELHDLLCDRGEHCMFLGTGGCTICSKCAYPEPCRFPERAVTSMEASGLLVSQVCKDSGLPYYYGPNTLTYTACILI